jgi:uncharacterized protein DUF6542
VADASVPRGPSPDAGWGPATSVRATNADAAPGRSVNAPSHDHNAAWDAAFPPRSPTPRSSARERLESTALATRERGLPGWVGLLVLAAIMVAGILVDAAGGHQLGTGFNIGIIAGSIIAVLIVRRSGMFPVVVAPPIVYSLGAGISLYVRSSGLHDRGVLIDAATNWLVYGFPAIAAATASVLIIAGIRLIARR